MNLARVPVPVRRQEMEPKIRAGRGSAAKEQEMTYIVLQAETSHGETKQVLVSEGAYDGDPSDFFIAGTVKNARKVGEVEILDDDNILVSDVFDSAN
jgi:hypothetical protein